MIGVWVLGWPLGGALWLDQARARLLARGGQDTPGIEITPTGRAEAGSRWTGKQPSEEGRKEKSREEE